jgi:putative DNA primase/helicase
VIRAVAQTAERGTEFALSDAGNAEYFVREADRRLAYDHTDRQWYQFIGHHWTRDTVQRVVDLAINAMRQRQRDAVLLTDSDARKRAIAWALKSENRRSVTDMLALAQAKAAIAVDGSEWDANPMLFGVANGVIDLEDGSFRSGMTFDRITKVAPIIFDPDATCPAYEHFLATTFTDYPDMPSYVQRCIGYCLTGLTTEQIFWILWVPAATASRHSAKSPTRCSGRTRGRCRFRRRRGRRPRASTNGQNFPADD